MNGNYTASSAFSRPDNYHSSGNAKVVPSNLFNSLRSLAFELCLEIARNCSLIGLSKICHANALIQFNPIYPFLETISSSTNLGELSAAMIKFWFSCEPSTFTPSWDQRKQVQWITSLYTIINSNFSSDESLIQLHTDQLTLFDSFLFHIDCLFTLHWALEVGEEDLEFGGENFVLETSPEEKNWQNRLFELQGCITKNASSLKEQRSENDLVLSQPMIINPVTLTALRTNIPYSDRYNATYVVKHRQEDTTSAFDRSLVALNLNRGQAAGLGALLLIPGGLALGALGIAANKLRRFGIGEDQQTPLTLNDYSTYLAENQVKRKLYPIRLQNESKGRIKVCIFKRSDRVCAIPLGGIGGYGTAFLNVGQVATFRPISRSDQFKIKVYTASSNDMLNAGNHLPIFTSYVGRGDEFILAESGINGRLRLFQENKHSKFLLVNDDEDESTNSSLGAPSMQELTDENRFTPKNPSRPRAWSDDDIIRKRNRDMFYNNDNEPQTP